MTSQPRNGVRGRQNVSRIQQHHISPIRTSGQLRRTAAKCRAKCANWKNNFRIARHPLTISEFNALDSMEMMDEGLVQRLRECNAYGN